MCSLRSCALSSYFNPLPLRRGRHLKCHIIVFLLQFQSTPSTQRETALNSLSCSILLVFQSTPSTQRETISANLIALSGRFQSTPSTQRETLFLPSCRTHKIFQSTPSTQRETISHLADISPEFISIHSLYAEGDFLRPTVSESQTNFNPLPLRRGRRWSSCHLLNLFYQFQSTPSTQRETAKINKILYSNPKNIVENTKLYISNTQQHTCRAHYPLPNYLSASANLPEIPCSLRIRTRTFPRQALLLA